MQPPTIATTVDSRDINRDKFAKNGLHVNIQDGNVPFDRISVLEG